MSTVQPVGTGIGELVDLIATETGRGSSRLVAPVRDDLELAALALALAPAEVRVAIITGFFIPRANPPAPETDGPLGAVLLAMVVAALGARATLVTDEACAAVLTATLRAGQGCAGGLSGSVDLAVWPAVPEGWTHLVAVERVGRTADGSYRNMRGVDISSSTAPLDDFFEQGQGLRIAIGDGGNEIGMGRLPADLVAATVDQGALIHSVVGCDHLVVAGTSNWGAYGLAALIADLAGRTEQVGLLLGEDFSKTLLEASVEAGAVDGVKASPSFSVDGLDWAEYWKIPALIGAHLAAQP